MKLFLIGENLLYGAFVSLRKETAAAIENGCNFRFVSYFVVKEAPVAIMPVKIPKECVNNEHAPEKIMEGSGRNIRLLIHGIHDVRKLSSRTIAFRIDNCVFYGTEVKQALTVNGKIFAGTDKFLLPAYRICAQHGFLRGYPDHVENAAGKMLADAAV